jgi:hypothetical protein
MITDLSSRITPAVPDSVDLEPCESGLAPPLRFCEIAMAAVASLIRQSTSGPGSLEADYLHRHWIAVAAESSDWVKAFRHAQAQPHDNDLASLSLMTELGGTELELLAVALTAMVEEDAMAGRALAYLQAPVSKSRPTLGLLATAFAPLGTGSSLYADILNGVAVRSGLLLVNEESAPLPERSLTVPTSLCLALAGHDAPWPGAQLGLGDAQVVTLPERVRRAAAEQAGALIHCETRGLLIRCASVAEARTAAALVAGALQRRPLFLQGDKFIGLGSLLTLRKHLPVFVHDLAPGERRTLPDLPGYTGPVIAIAGLEGSVEGPLGSVPTWTLPVPDAQERVALWTQALRSPYGPSGPDTQRASLIQELARHQRHSAGRIAQLARLAQHHATLGKRAQPVAEDLAAAAWTSEGVGLDTLAEPMRMPVPDEAVVVSGVLRRQLDLLVLRCRARDGLADGLGPATAVRYRPGVRALFLGPSGTGKTLAAAWLATRLRLPLYRVDLSSVTSKYIGETEKNLSRLLTAAERDDVILLFDEADSLFGKRTEIRDSNDRFANAQTNYLLQRIENYDGIVLLTSNSKQRFDSAFARRLDLVLEFPMPSPEERRALWLAHLGHLHDLGPDHLNRLAALADVPGGVIRNAVLSAALLARHAGRLIQLPDCTAALEAEYRKLGRQLPPELRPAIPT